MFSEDLKGTGLSELVVIQERGVTELHVSLVLRLHRVGFTNEEIARPLPKGRTRNTRQHPPCCQRDRFSAHEE